MCAYVCVSLFLLYLYTYCFSVVFSIAFRVRMVIIDWFCMCVSILRMRLFVYVLILDCYMGIPVQRSRLSFCVNVAYLYVSDRIYLHIKTMEQNVCLFLYHWLLLQNIVYYVMGCVMLCLFSCAFACAWLCDFVCFRVCISLACFVCIHGLCLGLMIRCQILVFVTRFVML